MSNVADKIMACVHGGDELRDLLGHEPNGFIIKDMEGVFGEEGHAPLFTELAHQIRQEESEMRSFCKRVEDAAKNKEELDLFGVAYTPLPTDADGEYIHIGDRVEDNERVARIVLTDGSWEPSVYIEKAPCLLEECFCNEVSHYHAPTVDELLDQLEGLRGNGADYEEVVTRASEIAEKLRELLKEDECIAAGKRL